MNARTRRSARRSARRRAIRQAWARDQYAPTPAARKSRVRGSGSGEAGHKSEWSRSPYVFSNAGWDKP